MTAAEIRAVRTARRRRDEGEQRLRAVIVAARDAGATLQQIADAAGFTRQRVQQITKERTQ